MNNSIYQETSKEPQSMLEATKHLIKILDAKYEKADLRAIVRDNCTHLSGPEQARPFPIPKKHIEITKREVQRLCDLGVLKWQDDSEWASPTFIIPKKDNTVRVVSNFREVNKRIVTRANKTKKKPWHWDDIHQQAFDTVNATIARDVTLAYPDYSQGFEIYTDSSKYQLGAVITQNNRPLAFFSRKLSQAQQKYSVTEQELRP
eukprot:CCRYP_014161-RA/>CCRYP_014161-RA protein AED:0.44 eAED:0.76 QI:0/0/0/1/0/0/3/0/203